MKLYQVTVYHNCGAGQLDSCYIFPDIAANSFCMAAAFGEASALRSSQTGVIKKVEVELKK